MGKQYKNKAKYSFAILLSLILGIGLFSCGNNEEPSSVNSSEQITTSEYITSSEETTSEEVTTEEESLEENSSIDVSSEEPSEDSSSSNSEISEPSTSELPSESSSVESSSEQASSEEENSQEQSSEDISSDTNSSEEESSIHVHTYTSVVTQPTCEEQGYTTHTCHCGHSYVDTYVDALNHSFTNYVSNKDATCIEDGTETAKCDRCDETHTRVKEDTALGHTVVVDEAVAPTCTETGLTEGSHCSTCNEILVAQEVIAATSHTYGNDYYYDKDYHWNLPTCEHKDILIKQEHTYVDGVCSECVYTEETNDVLTFNLSDDGTYYTVSYCDVNAVNIVIPYYYNDLPVKGIDEYAFLGCLLLEKVNIPNSVISIGESAFEDCSSLESITIPFVGQYKDRSGATHFGYIFGASYYSYNNDYVPTSLKEVIITGVTSIGDYAFCNCRSLTSIVIPDSVTSIGDSSFYNCSSLESIVIPDSVTSIGNNAFYDCDKLEYNEYRNAYYLGNENNPYQILVKAKDQSIAVCIINKNTKIILDNAFLNCYYLKTAVFEKGTQLTTIKDSAFYYCSRLTNIELPNTLESIGNNAFYYCRSLTSITIPESVTSIGESAFEDCSSLTNIELPNTLESIGNNAFRFCSSLTSIVIPDSVTSIGDFAFSGCSSLTSIELPSTLESTGYYAFSGCSSLENFYYNGTIEDWCNITFINYNSNPMCYATNLYFLDENGDVEYDGNKYSLLLNEVVIPNSVTAIKPYAFCNCSSLSSIVIPDSVTSIGNCAFSGCNSLESITIPFVGQYADGSGETFFGYIFGASSYYYDDYVPTSLKEVIITGGTSIEDSSFYNCSSLESIVIPDSVTSIGDSAFCNCSSLTSIVIPDSVTSIGNGAFYDCSSLESITIPFVGQYKDGSGATHFGYIFDASSYSYNDDYVPTSLKEVIITGGTSIGDYAFHYCRSLTSITIPESVTSIGNYAFRSCSSLTSIVIPDSVTSIGDYAFCNCSSLTIYCESTSKPSGWSYYWNYSSRPVYWPVYWANEWEYVDGVPTPINN